MNAAFYKIDDQWINVDRIIFINREGDDPEKPENKYIIHFCGGDQLTIDEKKAKKLAEFLKQNQAKNFNK